VRQYDPYFTAFYLNQIDAFSHKFWHYYEPYHFPDGKAEDIERYGDMIPRVYQMADEAVGHLIRLTEQETLVVVVSDHGFEAALDANKGDKFVCRLLGDNLLSALDLASTVRYVNHLNKLVLQILHQRQEVLALLRAIQVEEMGRPLLDLFEESTGEVILRVAGPNDYRDVDLSRLHVTWPGGRKPFLEWVETRSFSTPGVHHPDGIAVFCGPGVQPGGHVADGSVLDLTPTVLALLGMPVARDMDGTVLTGAIAPEFLEESPISYIDTYESDLEWSEVEDEEPLPEELMARLRSLGYLG
jgi:arylsulfatase A-like enzyme